jgi:hypothetical protein
MRNTSNVNRRRFYRLDENSGSESESESEVKQKYRRNGFLYNYDDVNGSDGKKKRSIKKSIKKSKKRRITSMFSRPKGKGLLILKMLKTKSPQKVYNILKKKSIKSGKKTWTKLRTIRTFQKLHM